MSRNEPKRSSVAAEQQAGNGSVEPEGPLLQSPAALRARMGGQSCREGPQPRSTESEVYDDGTNTFFW